MKDSFQVKNSLIDGIMKTSKFMLQFVYLFIFFGYLNMIFRLQNSLAATWK